MDFTIKLNAHLARVEAGIDAHVPKTDTRPSRLHAAMRYSLEAGGKRVRPVLVLAAAELGGTSAGTASANVATSASEWASSPLAGARGYDTPSPDPIAAAVAIECVHTYSLIHDDLPCMDDDDLRRGRPTCHKAFDEATALLAGDALLTHAFALLATAYSDRPALAHALIHELADAAGSRRLIGGQMEDLLAEKKADATASELEFIHLNKTAAMIEAALVMGGLVGGLAPDALKTLRRAGQHLGLAFQIIDDVLDATSDSATLGKTAGKDARADKTTYVKLYGLDVAREHARRHTQAALEACAALPGDTEFLRALIEQLVSRVK